MMNKKQNNNTIKNISTKVVTQTFGMSKSNIKFSAEVGLGLPIARGTTTYNKMPYIPYSSDAIRYNVNNVYPQQLARMYSESATHKAAINRKSKMIQGEGIDLSKVNTNLRKVLNNLTLEGLTINDLLAKISKDYALYNGFAIKVVWGKDGYIKHLKHIPFEYVRVGQPINKGDEMEIPYYVISNNWTKDRTPATEITYTLPRFNPDYFNQDLIVKDNNGLPQLTEEQLTNGHQLLYCFESDPNATSGTEFYPTPDYSGAIDSILTEIKINISDKALIDNGFGGKTIITLPTLPSSQEERDELEADMQYQFTNATNNGGLVTLFNNNPELQVNVNQIEALSADTYSGLSERTKQTIITAHNIPAILLEYNYGGGFNNRAEEMIVAYHQFQQTVIKWYQQSILAVLNRLMTYVGWDVKLEITPFQLTPVISKDEMLNKNTSQTSNKGTSNESSNQVNTNVSTQQESSLESN